jgi:subtilisin family serine protease
MELRMFPRGAAISGLILLTFLALGSATTVAAAEPDPDRYIVSFLDVDKGKSALKAAGARVELNLAGREAAAAHIPARALKGLRNNPHIEYIEKDALRFPMAQTTPWGIPAVQANLVSHTGAANRTVCIIDSGYELFHEDLPNGNNVSGENNSVSGNWGEDSCFHGTHVAGTIAALANNNKGVVGVMPSDNVGLHIVKVFDGPNCAWAYSSSLVAALDECETAGANVVSMSLGGSFKSRTEERAFRNSNNAGVLSIAAAGNDGNTRKSYPASYSSVVSVAAVDSAGVVADFSQQNDQVELAGPGVAVRSTVGTGEGLEESLEVDNSVFEATGMEGSAKGTATGSLFRCNAVDGLGSPGDCAGAQGRVCLISRGDITFAEKVQECESKGGVAAVIFNSADALFSGTMGGETTRIPSVGISGKDGASLGNFTGKSATVTVEIGNYAYYDGTSMATPHVSGVAALVWSQDTGCTNDEIRTALAGTAIDLGPAGRDNAYGYGLVQAAAAADAITREGGALQCGGGGGDGGDGGDGGGGSCSARGASCTADSECCSGACKGKRDSKSCK